MLPARWPTSETQLGPPVIDWLRSRGWDVYQEVTGPGGRADIVATCGRLVAVVELKLVLGLDVIVQAGPWRAWAHLVWCGVPAPQRRWGAGQNRRLLRDVAEWKGIGVIEVAPADPHVWKSEVRAQEIVHPAVNRAACADDLRSRLHPEQKTALAAGSQAGGQWTEFKATCRNLRDYIASLPGSRCEMNAAIVAIKHHYANARSARRHLLELVEIGRVPGLKVERGGGKVYVVAT